MTKKKVAVAMSGGVDSSVAASLLLQRGYEVIGLTMELFSLPKEFCHQEGFSSCCGKGAVTSANAVAARLCIPHYLVDVKEDFKKYVVDNFCQEYRRGRTPNPCIRCNQYLKFGLLWEKARQLGADFLATGHHARIEYNHHHSLYYLKKGKDPAKDQSYFLYPLTQEQLSHTLFPVGEYSKKEIRKLARQLGLPSAERAESQEICFIPDRDYVRFLKERIPEAFRPGKILDESGRQLGTHQGIPAYTIGQRRGMGIAFDHPLYVVALKAEKNVIIAGPESSLYSSALVASQINFIIPLSSDSFEAQVRIRYRHKEAAAKVFCLDNDHVKVVFRRPQRAITPGQSVVFYQGDCVIGGGVIEKVLPQ